VSPELVAVIRQFESSASVKHAKFRTHPVGRFAPRSPETHHNIIDGRSCRLLWLRCTILSTSTVDNSVEKAAAAERNADT
jgi:hypothetical protein